LIGTATAQEKPKKLTAADVVAQHLDSLGTVEARASASKRVVGGQIRHVIRIGGGGFLDGGGVFTSSGSKLKYMMKFPNVEYPEEQMVFDGERARTGILPQGGRTILSQFLDQQNLPLKEGLFGGVLSTAWPLIGTPAQQLKLDYRGQKKIDGIETHTVSYRPRKGSSDLKVTLYFDASTFRHLRTEYRFEIGARLGSGGANDSARVQESYYVLTEDFDDFRAVDGLSLPHKYKLQISVSTSGGSMLRDWTMSVSEVSHKATVDEQAFSLK
jgi:hypothetical protein